MTTSKPAFKLAVCTLFDPILYGTDENSTPGIENHYYIVYTFKPEKFYNNDYISMVNYTRRMVQRRAIHPHPTIRNYNNMLPHIKLDIVKCDELTGLEQVGYIKTFWLKIVQRRWKNVYKERQDLLKARSNPVALRERQLTGQWSKHLRQWPQFRLNLR
jgi:hypothetical protein